MYFHYFLPLKKRVFTCTNLNSLYLEMLLPSLVEFDHARKSREVENIFLLFHIYLPFALMWPLVWKKTQVPFNKYAFWQIWLILLCVSLEDKFQISPKYHLIFNYYFALNKLESPFIKNTSCLSKVGLNCKSISLPWWAKNLQVIAYLYIGK